jgi:hypothetical protein
VADTAKKQIFLVVGSKNPAAILTRIQELKLPYHSLQDDVWLIAYNGTTREMAEVLGVRDGSVGTGIVSAINSYSGRAAQEVWEWLKVNWPQDG